MSELGQSSVHFVHCIKTNKRSSNINVRTGTLGALKKFGFIAWLFFCFGTMLFAEPQQEFMLECFSLRTQHCKYPGKILETKQQETNKALVHQENTEEILTCSTVSRAFSIYSTC